MVMKPSERKDSNPRHAGYKPAALDQLSYVPKGVGGGLLLTRRLYVGKSSAVCLWLHGTL